MNTEEKTRTEVARRIERLQDRYGEFTVDDETVENDAEFFEQGREMVQDGWIGDAGAWVTDAENRVLLIRHEGAPDEWGIPGGGYEPGETMEETAKREVREETGIECILTDVTYARRKAIVLASNPSERYYMLTTIFDATYDEGFLSIGDDEILEAKWFSRPPADINDFVQEKVSKWNANN